MSIFNINGRFVDGSRLCFYIFFTKPDVSVTVSVTEIEGVNGISFEVLTELLNYCKHAPGALNNAQNIYRNYVLRSKYFYCKVLILQSVNHTVSQAQCFWKVTLLWILFKCHLNCFEKHK